MRFNKSILSGIMVTALLVGSCSKDSNEMLNDQDEDFLIKASITNNAEISAATLAVSKATSTSVKAFAQHMISEHSLALTDLKNVGASVNFPVKDSIDPVHAAMAAQLSALSGRTFDSTYIHAQVADHKTAVSLFQTEQNQGRHKDVINYANTYLPHIQMHLVSADSIATAFFKR